MPAAPSSGAFPSFTSANAKKSTHEMAKNNVVYAISRLRTSTVRPFLRTSQAVRITGLPHDGPVGRAQRIGTGDGFRDSAVPQEQRAVEQTFGKIQVVRCKH